MNNLARLDEYKELANNWNENGAKPFSVVFIESVKEMIRNLSVQPDVFPTARDSIQLEYEDMSGEYLELEVFEDRIATLYMSADGEEEEEIIGLNKEDIDKVVSKFHGKNGRA